MRTPKFNSSFLSLYNTTARTQSYLPPDPPYYTSKFSEPIRRLIIIPNSKFEFIPLDKFPHHPHIYILFLLSQTTRTLAHITFHLPAGIITPLPFIFRHSLTIMQIEKQKKSRERAKRNRRASSFFYHNEGIARRVNLRAPRVLFLVARYIFAWERTFLKAPCEGGGG